MPSRNEKVNTQGGKGFKKGKKGAGGFRVKAAQDGALEMLDLIRKRNSAFKGISVAEKEEAERALLELQVGRITRNMGNSRFEVLCHDGVARNCALRPLLRRKGQCYVGVDSIVTVSLSTPLDELDSSDDEGQFGKGTGNTFSSQYEQGYIAGIFDADAIKELRKTRITKTLFVVTDANGEQVDEDEYFDRSDKVCGEDGTIAAEGGSKKEKKKKGAAAASAGGGAEGDINLKDL